MPRTLSRALTCACALTMLGLAWACGDGDDDDGQVDALEGRLHLEVGGSGNGTVTLGGGGAAFSGSCTRITSPCERSDDLDANGPRTVTLTAVPDVGSFFSGWAGNCLAVSGTPTQATVAMSSEITYDCIAEFTLNPAADCRIRFDENDWIVPALVAQVVAGDGAVSQSRLRVGTGGNPPGPTFIGDNPGYQSMEYVMDLPVGTSGTSRITVAYFSGAAIFFPAAPISKFIYREDQITVSNPDALPVTWGMAVKQDAQVFLAPLGTFNSPTWQRQEVDVTEASFTAPGPDLSQPFEVGYFRSTTTAANPAAGSTVEHGIDNWQIATCE